MTGFYRVYIGIVAIWLFAVEQGFTVFCRLCWSLMAFMLETEFGGIWGHIALQSAAPVLFRLLRSRGLSKIWLLSDRPLL